MHLSHIFLLKTIEYELLLMHSMLFETLNKHKSQLDNPILSLPIIKVPRP